MYLWIWRHLPGNRLVKTAITLSLITVAVWLLFGYVFPWLEPVLPFNEVTVR